MKIPINDVIIESLSRLVDDAQSEKRRDYSHSDIAFQIKKAGLEKFDPNELGNSPSYL